MAKKKDISIPREKTLTAEDLKRYEAGEMTFQEMNRVEKILLEQPFYADAVEGLSELRKDKVLAVRNIDDLKIRLGNRINQATSKPTPVFNISRLLKPVSIAAAILLVFAGTYYIIDNQKKEITTAVIAKSRVSTDNLSEPTANASTIAKEDNTALNKTEALPRLQEKQKQSVKYNKHAQAVERKTEEPPVEEEIIANIISKTEETENIVTEVPPQPAGAAPAPKVVEKKSVVDREELPVESKTLGGAARMARATISGKVVDEENQPIKDVTVNIRGESGGIKTDEEGKFTLRDTRKGDIVIFNSLTMPQMEVPLKNNLPGKIVYSEENIKPPSKPKVSVNSPQDAMLGTAATDARPEFGWEAFEVYLKENTRRPPKALQANIQGRVIVSFKVNEKGELSDFAIIRSLGSGCDEEAIRIIKNGPKWFPATKEDKPIMSSSEIVVRFR